MWLEVGFSRCSQITSFPFHTSASIRRLDGPSQPSPGSCFAPEPPVSQPAATAGGAKEVAQALGCQRLLPTLRCLLSSRKGGWVPGNPRRESSSLPPPDKPCLLAERQWWGLGKRSTPHSFVLFDLHLKYIWKAAETLMLNRLPTQMLSTKKLPGIIILPIYQFVTRIWHILSLEVRNNNFPPWRLERDGILLQMLNSHDYQPGVRIPNTKLLRSAQQLPYKKNNSLAW